MVRIRRILSAAYQEKYFTAVEPFSPTPVSTWVLCSQATEWFNKSPNDSSESLSILYRLEFLYTTIIILSPSTRHSPICDYTRLLLFNRCIDYIYQLHQLLDSRTWLSVLTSLDLQRVYQVSRRFINIFSQGFDCLVSFVPATPQVPDDCPNPPLLKLEECLHCNERAIECLNQIGNLLLYAGRRWNLHHLSQDFMNMSAPVRRQLLTPTFNYASTMGTYMPEGPTLVAPTDYQYTGIKFENSSPESHN